MALDDVSKISFSSLKDTTGLNSKAQKQEKTKKDDEPVVNQQINHQDPDNILDALALSGYQNKALVGLNLVDPTRYLTPERIADIEKSMSVFEEGVQKNLDVINQEFGGIGADLSEQYKLELAAQMML